MDAATITSLRDRQNRGPDGDYSFVIACRLGFNGPAAKLAAEAAETEIGRAGPRSWNLREYTRIADRIVQLIERSDPARANATCACSHPGTRHRPSAVTPFGLGLCRDKTCGCARYTPNADVRYWPEPPYPPVAGQHRYALVVHRAAPARWDPVYAPAELVAELPAVSADTYRVVAHRAVEPDGAGRVAAAYVYADWGGGPHHRIAPDRLWIHHCGCDTEGFHAIGRADGGQRLINELTPLLEWTNRHTGLHDWCELVPIPPGAPPVVRTGNNPGTRA